MEEVPFVDAHTHAPGEGVSLLDVGTAVPDKERCAPGVCYSVGIHPARLADNAPVDWEAFRRSLLCERVLAVGECGLDRRLPVPLREQEEVFRRQAEAAEERGMPVVVHCVRACPELISIRRTGAFRMPWIVHGFNNNGQTLRQLLAHDFRFSLGAALLNPESNAVRLLPEIPLERLFLETDDRPLGIRLVYEAAAACLGMEVAELKRRIWTNFKNMFYGMVE